MATGISLKFVTPQPTPDYDKQVLIPLHKAQAEHAAQVEADARKKAQEAAQAALVAQQPASTPAPTPAPYKAPVQTTISLGTSLLDAIARCESSGNPRATNGTHFGLFQFDLSTWASVGGSGNPMDASVAEQYMRAQILLNERGTQPWLASMPCWG